jgi:hypothetical protein
MAAGDLTTLTAVKGYVQGLEVADNTFDVLLARLITAVSAQFVADSGTNISQATYTERRSGNGRAALTLKNAPVSSVTSVTVDGTTVAAQTVVGGPGWVLDGSTLQLVGSKFTEGTLNVTVVYVAGYALVPLDVEQAVIKMVGLQFSDRKRIGQGSASTGGESVSFADGAVLAYWNGTVENYRDQAI